MLREYFEIKLVVPVIYTSDDDTDEEDEDSDAENSDGDYDENSNDESAPGVSELPDGIISELPEGSKLPEVKWRRTATLRGFDWLCAASTSSTIRHGKYKVVFCFTHD